jgi:hypothetical protein
MKPESPDFRERLLGAIDSGSGKEEMVETGEHVGEILGAALTAPGLR